MPCSFFQSLSPACSSDALLRKLTATADRHSALLAQLLDVERAVGREEQHLRCTRVAADLVETGELQTTCYDLQALSGRLLALGDALNDSLQHAASLGPFFVAEHWHNMDSRLSCAANRLAQLQEACAALLSAISAELQAAPRAAAAAAAQAPPKPTTAPASAPRTAAVAARGRLWRFLRAGLPYHLSLLLLFGCFYFLLADDCPLSSRLLLSPQLRYAFGSPL